MENIELQSSMLYSAYGMKELEDECKDLTIDYVLDYGTTKINDDKFEILNLKGHAPENIGIITSDKVCFLGDAIFSDSILDKYSFPYLFNIDESLKTLNIIKDIEADYFLISHAEGINDRTEIIKLADKNISNINRYLEEILEILEKPTTKEELMENIIVLNDLSINFRQYHLNFSSMSAFLTYLYNKGAITYSIENGKLYYYKKE
jgi:glyoxylase-like metal-dependent hydrolase (beta-lactamase superfamily II)